ncbi:MAG: SapC family protein [Gammaproteobacteria bacterium]
MSSRLEIPIPAGYRQAVPFDRSKHRGLGVSNNAAGFASTLHAIYLTQAEITRAGLDYPVVFASDATQEIVPLALLGVEPHSNLYCDASGQWAHDCYVPAYVRRYPFFMARLKGSQSRGVICVDESALSANADPLILESGDLTDSWSKIQKLVEQMDAESSRTLSFCAQLQSLSLLEKFDAHFHPDAITGATRTDIALPRRLNGLMRVSRKALGSLSNDDALTLMRSGAMQFIEAHLNSLYRFDRLLNLYAVTASRGS